MSAPGGTSFDSISGPSTDSSVYELIEINQKSAPGANLYILEDRYKGKQQ